MLVVGGSPGMTGAPSLAAAGALRAGAGYAVRLVPGSAGGRGPAASGLDRPPIESVAYPAPERWAATALERLDRFGAAVVGPGLASAGSSPATGDVGDGGDGGDDGPAELGAFLAGAAAPTVLDAGAIDAVADLVADRPDALIGPGGHVRHVLTPHDGEFRRLTGAAPGDDRVAATRAAAARLGAVVLLKGPTTIVAHPDGRVLLSVAGDQRLATAGSGDVLSGVLAAGMAGGLEPFEAAGLAAEVHGLAAQRGYRVGMTAGDLPSLVAATLSDLTPGG